MLILFLAFFSPALAAPTPSVAVVHHCSDGDTCRLEIQSGETKVWFNVRLFGIDAPEIPHGKKKGQPLGEDAKRAINAKLQDKRVAVTQADLDPYNRPVVEIHLQQENVNLWMIQNGFAEAYRGKSKRLDRESYYRAEEQAKKEKKGIWSLKNYQSPSVFRHEQPKGDSETW